MTFNKKYHNESTAPERSVMNYSGRASMCVYACVCRGVGVELKLALQDPNPRSQLP